MADKPEEEAITVVVRTRSIESYADSKGGMRPEEGVMLEEDENRVTIMDGRQVFNFDCVFESNATQEDVYQEICYPLVESCFEGFDCTVFTYGARGSGKTHSMIGDFEADDEEGLMYRAIEQVFTNIKAASGTGQQFLVQFSFVQVCANQCHDLLFEPTGKKGESDKVNIRESKKKRRLPRRSCGESGGKQT